MKVVKAFTFDSVRDADLLTALEQAGNASAFVRESIRSYLAEQSAIARDLEWIKARLMEGVIVAQPDQKQKQDHTLIDEAMDKLDKIGR